LVAWGPTSSTSWSTAIPTSKDCSRRERICPFDRPTHCATRARTSCSSSHGTLRRRSPARWPTFRSGAGSSCSRSRRCESWADHSGEERGSMKVVLFCGGFGSRLREHAGTIPKPLVTIGSRPILWHLMRYYAHYGHREFILCLGYRAELVHEYFASDADALAEDWDVTLVDTGMHTSVGERLKAVAPQLKDEEIFLANYSDGLSDLPLEPYLEAFRGSNAVATLVSVRPSQTFHVVDVDD